jgi:7-carboxy-7-deazaguanine synthase
MPYNTGMEASLAHRIALLAEPRPEQLLIHEIYRSIQGESTFAGLPCVFVRLAVCDSRCVWCDTPHAFNQGDWMAVDQVLRRALSFECPLIEITGGEPLLQADVLPLMTKLADAGLTVLLETSGAHDVAPVDPRVHVIMDLKFPDSGECERNYWPNLERLKPSDQIKFVIATRRDFEWTVETVRRHTLADRFTLLISPVTDCVSPRDLAEWVLASGLPLRMQMQLHKVIWDPATRGV